MCLSTCRWDVVAHGVAVAFVVELSGCRAHADAWTWAVTVRVAIS